MANSKKFRQRHNEHVKQRPTDEPKARGIQTDNKRESLASRSRTTVKNTVVCSKRNHTKTKTRQIDTAESQQYVKEPTVQKNFDCKKRIRKKSKLCRKYNRTNWVQFGPRRPRILGVRGPNSTQLLVEKEGVVCTLEYVNYMFDGTVGLRSDTMVSMRFKFDNGAGFRIIRRQSLKLGWESGVVREEINISLSKEWETSSY